MGVAVQLALDDGEESLFSLSLWAPHRTVLNLWPTYSKPIRSEYTTAS